MANEPVRIQRILDWYKSIHRATNYLSVAMLYLKDNFLLSEKLLPEHIKNRILGHWGTVPGLNFIYNGLNYIAKKDKKEILFVSGPGHGAPAVLSNLFFEGTLEKFYPQKYSKNLTGFSNLIKDFSSPTGFPSHTSPMVPGTILEGGELGYSLGTAYGAVMDSPNSIAACVIGDGEAETATINASWQSNKFLNPVKDGTVLPIIHLNSYRISGPTVLSSMSNFEIESFFTGLGFTPLFVEQNDSDDIYIDFLEVLIKSFNLIDTVKATWLKDHSKLPLWPVIILKTKKGWSAPAFINNKRIEDSNNSHGIPLQNPKTDSLELSVLSKWLESYGIRELINSDGNFKDFLFDFIPEEECRIGQNKHAFGGKSELKLPNLQDHELRHINPGKREESRARNLAEYLRDIIDLNTEQKNFRIFSPDESESNQLESVFAESGRRYIWPLRKEESSFSPDGRILEILSENLLMTWIQGYVLTGRHGVLISYEAFLNIVSSQIDQYIKFLKGWRETNFRHPIPSLNLVATSTLWRQEHNGFTHQNPTLINSFVTKFDPNVKVYFPIDVNSLLATANTVFGSSNGVNLIVECKRDLPQWFSLDQSHTLVKKGFLDLPLSSLRSENTFDLHIISIGDYQNLETIAGISLIKEFFPNINVRAINVNEISGNGFASEEGREEFLKILKESSFTLFNFHGYPTAIEQLLFKAGISAASVKVLGYIEKGTTTTPFDMEVQNKASRVHVLLESTMALFRLNKISEGDMERVKNWCSEFFVRHNKYIAENNTDLPEITSWEFKISTTH